MNYFLPSLRIHYIVVFLKELIDAYDNISNYKKKNNKSYSLVGSSDSIVAKYLLSVSS
jgi:hypothetical protein